MLSSELITLFRSFNLIDTLAFGKKKKGGIQRIPRKLNPETILHAEIYYNTLLFSFSDIPIAGPDNDSFAPNMTFNWRSGVIPLVNAYFIQA